MQQSFLANNMLVQPPLTPVPSISGSTMSSRSSVVDPARSQTTPSERHVHTTPLLKRKRERERDKPHNGQEPIIIHGQSATSEQLYFIDDDSMDKAFSLLVQNKWINDDCVNSLLEIFNPDPSVWLVFSTLTNTQSGLSDSRSFNKSPSDSPEKLMIPLHLSNMHHWVLAAYDKTRRHCMVYDPKGDSKCVERTMEIVQDILRKHNSWQEDCTTGVDCFPSSMRQTDSNNCGIFVIAAALLLFNDLPIKSFTPDLWRDLLAAYFCIRDKPPRDLISKRLTSVLKSADLDRGDRTLTDNLTRKAKVITDASLRASDYADEARLLLKMADDPLQRLRKQEEDRERLLRLASWYAQKPDGASYLTDGIIAASREQEAKQLKAMPKLIKGAVGQLTALRNHCSSVIDECTIVARKLQQERDDVLKKAMSAYLDIGSKLAVS